MTDLPCCEYSDRSPFCDSVVRLPLSHDSPYRSSSGAVDHHARFAQNVITCFPTDAFHKDKQSRGTTRNTVNMLINGDVRLKIAGANSTFSLQLRFRFASVLSPQELEYSIENVSVR